MSWQSFIDEELSSEKGQLLIKKITSDEAAGKIIFPDRSNWFKAFELTPFSSVRVVIVGQDPYHEEGQACGLSFSVPDKIKIPPSLRNIYKELERSIDLFTYPETGNLESWAKQGVLLINRVLTVEKGMAGSHRGWGWEGIVLRLLKRLTEQKSSLIFLLWGKDALSLASELDLSNQIVLIASHPSPLSAYRGFLGSNHFAEVNKILKARGELSIDWQV